MTMTIEKRTIFQFFTSGLSFVNVFLKRPSSIKPNFNLGHEMKLLNDRKEFKSAIKLFEKYSTNNNQVLASFVITQALKACAGVKDVDRGSMIHSRIRSVKKIDSYVMASLINMYGECDRIEEAQTLFDTTEHKTEAIYATMMKIYMKNDQLRRVMELFLEMENPNEVNVTILLNTCARLRTSEALNVVRKCTKDMPKRFLSNPRLFTSLLDALMKCGDVEYAESLFNSSSRKDQQSYGAMIKGYIENTLYEKAIDIFHEIKAPDETNAVLLFNACAQLRTGRVLDTVKTFIKQMPSKFLLHENVFTSLLDALMKCGDVAYAESLFRASKENTLHSYGAMMKGYIVNKTPEKAISLFQEMTKPGAVQIALFFNACAQLRTDQALRLAKHFSKQMTPTCFLNEQIFNSFLDLLLKCDDIQYAESFFDKSNHKSSAAYGTMIFGLANEDHSEKALNLFNQMTMSGIEKSMIAYLGAIKAVSRLCDRSTAQWIVQQIPECVLVKKHIQNCLIDLWGKVGCIDEAKLIFDKMDQPNEISYSAMINAYCLNGMGVQAIELFRRIPQQLMNEATYVCTLNACSHSGLISEACDIFQNIKVKTEKIYSIMIDCLSRASCFVDAQKLIDEYERDHSPQPIMYMALLSAARNTNNTDLSRNIYNRMKELFPEAETMIVSGAVLLANTYASSGEIGKALEIRQELIKSGMKKKVGMTRTVIEGQIYTFKAHDRSHPRSDEIYAELERISEELLKHGHQYDASWITRSLNQDETVASALCGHSERLAIAWNFVANPNTSRIQLSKNLRVCGDCHRSTKLIAAIRQCEIIVRDANRVHHFYKNGQCSCNDYF